MHSLRLKVLAAGWAGLSSLLSDSFSSEVDILTVGLRTLTVQRRRKPTGLHADGHRDQFSLDLITLFLLDLTVLFSLSI